MSPQSRGLEGHHPLHPRDDHHHNHHHDLHHDLHHDHPHKKGHLEEALMPRAVTPELLGRGSFSSVREHGSGLAQTFTSSKTSSYAREIQDDAISDSSTDVEMGEPEYLAPLTQPHSKLHGGWYPVGTFKGWKGIAVKGRKASRSFSDLQALNPFRLQPEAHARHHEGPMPPGTAPIERLPPEILCSIVELLVVETPTMGITKRNADLMALLLSSKAIHNATLTTLYRHVTIPHSKIFRKFLSQITEYPDLGSMVRRLDFNHFNPAQLFMTEAERTHAHNLTSETLLKCLDLTPKLKEFLAQEQIAENLSAPVLRKLFFDLPMLEAVDFCDCWHPEFKRSFESFLGDFESDKRMISISRLSFHKANNLPPTVFETIFPRLEKVTHLDVAACRVTPEALFSIPKTARITHLNLAKCKRLPAGAVIKFLATHPAVKSSLQVLNLGTDAVVYEMLDEEDLARLLPLLPKTLKSLSLKGSKMGPDLVPLLLPLTRRVEELALGRCINVAMVHHLLKPHDELGPHTLRYLDISDLVLSNDIDDIFDARYGILKNSSAPLHVIEVAERPFKRLNLKAKGLLDRGWALKESGLRYWMVRADPQVPRENPYRPWKMGAESWGSRKIPVAVAEVGGRYGYHMFTTK